MSKSTFPGADTVNQSIWLGGEIHQNADQWFPYWTNGNVPLIALIRAAGAESKLDKEIDLAGSIDSYMEYVLAHTNKTSGWIGPWLNEPGDLNGHGLWDPLNMVRSLMMWAEDHVEMEPKVAAAVVAHLTKEAELLQTDKVIKWASTRWPTFVQICQAVEDSYIAKYGSDSSIMPLGGEGTRTLLSNASALFKERGMDWSDYYHQIAVKKNGLKKFPEAEVYDWNVFDHGVNNAEGALNWPAVTYRMTGNSSDAAELGTVLGMLDKYQGQINALLCADEVFCGRAPHRGTETCAVVEAMASLEHSFTVLGNATLVDRLERLAFNALPAALSGDMWQNVYVQQANSVFAGKSKPSLGSRGAARCGRDLPEDLLEPLEASCRVGDTPSAEDEGSNFFGVSHFPCCITNFPQGWPKFAMHAIVADTVADPPAAVVASLVPAAATMPSSIGGGARVVVDTQYPFSDSVTFTISARSAMELKVRIPGWASRASLNGRAVANGTFAAVACKEGQTVARLELKPEVRQELGWGELGRATSAPVSYAAAGAPVPTAEPRDLYLEGGASLVPSWEPGQVTDLSSGGPGQNSTATVTHPVVGEGHYLSEVSMTYRYMSGFKCLPGDCAEPPRLELVAQDLNGTELATLYSSPGLDKYPLVEAGYSPPVHVRARGLKIANARALLLKLRMLNGRHNVQLQLDATSGFAVSVKWSSATGPEAPTPPSPWVSPPMHGLGVTRGPLVFALHPKESRRVVKTYDQPPLRPQAVDTEIGTNDTWNYGLVPSKGFDFVATPSAGWTPGYAFDRAEYPFYIKASARQVNAWGFWQGSMITDVPPPSPVDCTAAGCEEEAELHLVPFGGTNIRISVFPWIEQQPTIFT